MTEQTPNEPHDPHFASVVGEVDAWLDKNRRTETWRTMNRVRDELVRAADALAALRARPKLDRGPLTNTEEIKLYHVIEKVVVDELHVQKVAASDEVTSAAVDWFNSAILAAVGQDTPEPGSATWKPEDGDTRCQQCAQPNPVWATAHDLWNSLVGNEGGVLCPRCFMMLSPETLWTVTAREKHDAEQGT